MADISDINLSELCVTGSYLWHSTGLMEAKILLCLSILIALIMHNCKTGDDIVIIEKKESLKECNSIPKHWVLTSNSHISQIPSVL